MIANSTCLVAVAFAVLCLWRQTEALPRKAGGEFGQGQLASSRQPTARSLLQEVDNVDATYYGAGGDANCYCKGNGLPYGNGSIPTVALGPNTFNNGAVCGQCIMMKGTGTGSGATPVPTTPTKYLVNNLCPECGSGVDIAKNGDGRWQVDYYFTSC